MLRCNAYLPKGEFLDFDRLNVVSIVNTIVGESYEYLRVFCGKYIISACVVSKYMEFWLCGWSRHLCNDDDGSFA